MLISPPFYYTLPPTPVCPQACFMYSLNKYLSVCYVPGTVQGAEDKAMNKTEHKFCPHRVYSVGETTNKINYTKSTVWRVVISIIEKEKARIQDRTTVWSCSPPAGHISGKNKNSNSKRHMHLSIHSSNIYNRTKTWKQPKCPLIDECIKKLYLYMQRTTTQS